MTGTGDGRTDCGRDMAALAERLYPIGRSLTGDGVRETLRELEKYVPIELHEVATGTPVYDWTIPREWNVRDAYVLDPQGRRVVDVQRSNLHLVGYSVPVDERMSLDALRPHLHSLPEQPTLVPYRTAYYADTWGFCLAHDTLEALEPGEYTVRVDSTLEDGALTYGDVAVPGRDPDAGVVLVHTHTCHPSLANDNCSGMAVAATLASLLTGVDHRLTYRFLFGPGQIGSITWLSRNEERLNRIRAGLIIGLLGDAGPLTYKRSRRGDCGTDRAAAHVLRSLPSSRIVDFTPWGYDERQFCSPGFDLPVGRLTRSPNGEYAEYHSSADNLDIVHPGALAESLRTLARLIAILDENRRLLNLNPKGEPRLGKRGLYGAVGGRPPSEFEHALLWLLNFSDGEHDLLSIAERSHIDFALIADAAAALEKAGLARSLDE